MNYDANEYLDQYGDLLLFYREYVGEKSNESIYTLSWYKKLLTYPGHRFEVSSRSYKS